MEPSATISKATSIPIFSISGTNQFHRFQFPWSFETEDNYSTCRLAISIAVVRAGGDSSDMTRQIAISTGRTIVTRALDAKKLSAASHESSVVVLVS